MHTVPEATSNSTTVAAPRSTTAAPKINPPARDTSYFVAPRVLNQSFSNTSLSSSSSSLVLQPSDLTRGHNTTATIAVVTHNNTNNNEESTIEKKKEQDKKKREQQRKFGMTLEEDDMVLADGGVGGLTSIRGIPVSKLSLETLKAFARKLRLKISSSVSKIDLLKELENYKRLGRERVAMKQAVVSSSSVGSGNSLPSGLLHADGTIFRLILTILDPTNRESYVGTAQQISRGELGAHERYVPNYAHLASAYNDQTNEEYDDAGVSLSPHQDIYECYGINNETPSTFDVLNATTFAQVLKFVHKKYRIARNNNKKSGTHDDFPNFIMGLPWILFYHERMEELGDNSSLYFNIAYPSLEDSVFVTSDGMTSAPGIENKRDSGKKLKRSPKDVEMEARIVREKAVVQKNLSCSRLFDYTSEMQMRKRQAEVMDEIMETEDKLEVVEGRLGGGDANDEHILRRVHSLKRKLSVLTEEEAKLSSAIQELSPASSNN